MNHFAIFVTNFISIMVIADCLPLKIIPNKLYKLICDSSEIEVNCLDDKNQCLDELNLKLKKFNIHFDGRGIKKVSSLGLNNADLVSCELIKNRKLLECRYQNKCERYNSSSNKIMTSLAERMVKSNCSEYKIISDLDLKNIAKMGGVLNEGEQTRQKIEDSFNKYCTNWDGDKKNLWAANLYTFIATLNTKLSGLDLTASTSSISNIYVNSCVELREADLDKESSIKKNIGDRLKENMKRFVEVDLKMCNELLSNNMSFDKFICIKTQELVSSEVNCDMADGIGSYTPKFVSTASANAAADELAKNITPDVSGNPEKFRAQLEAVPVIEHRETLAKIDKLVQENGGKLTPDVAERAGRIFHDGIYAPTKKFIDSFNTSIESSGFDTASSSRIKNSKSSRNAKLYEIGGNRIPASNYSNASKAVGEGVAASLINSKANAGDSFAAEELDNLKKKREPATGSSEVANKSTDNLVTNSQAGTNYSGGAMGNSSGTTARTDFDEKNKELSKLQPLSTSEKGELNLVVKALAEAEVPVDVKTIVESEGNFLQVKRLVQEMEINNKSASVSEIKDFVKILEKFGIKVYGANNLNQAIYTPADVKHVIKIEGNSIRFMNKLRSGK